MAMMKAKRFKRSTHSSRTISPSESSPITLTQGSIWLMRSSRSSAWATRFENWLA